MTQDVERNARRRERAGLRHPGQVFSAKGKAADDATPEDDPAESAKAAGLRYVSADAPGIRRVKSGSVRCGRSLCPSYDQSISVSYPNLVE